MTHLICWGVLALPALPAAFFELCEPRSAVIWAAATFVALATHSLFGEEA